MQGGDTNPLEHVLYMCTLIEIEPTILKKEILHFINEDNFLFRLMNE